MTRVDYRIVDEIPTDLEPDMIYFIPPKPNIPGRAYISNKEGTSAMMLPTQFIEPSSPPILDFWHCQADGIYCGQSRILKTELNNSVPSNVMIQTVNWICEVLNVQMEAHRVHANAKVFKGTF